MKKFFAVSLLLCCISTASFSQAGIGVRLASDSIATGRWPYISEILENSPAAESNLLAYAWVTAVDGTSTVNLTVADVVKKISGAEGTTVIVRMKDNGIETDVPLIRRKISIKEAGALITPSLIPYRIGALFGYVNQQKKLIIPAVYSRALPFAEDVANVEMNNRWGVIDTLGNTLAAPVYETVSGAVEGMMVYTDKGLEGYLDTKGKVVITAKYKRAANFSNGMAKVKSTNGYWGFIDKNGREITPMKYDEADNFNYGLGAVALNKHYAFVNEKGKEVTPFKYEFSIYFPKFSNGLCRVYDGKHYGFIDPAGNEVLPIKYTRAEDFENGIAAVAGDDGRFSLINKKGEATGTEKFGEVNGGYSSSMMAVKEGSSFIDKYGYTNKRGKIEISVAYNYAGEFINGYAVVSDDEYEAYPIDVDGKKVVTEPYDKITQFKNGMVILEKKGGKKAFATQAGKFKPITPFKYDYAYEFNNGLAWVNFNGAGAEGYYVDAKGNEYYDAGAAATMEKKAEDDKYVNTPDKLNEHPTDGGAGIKTDDVWVGYLSLGDEKKILSDDKKSRFIDGYNISINKGDRLILHIDSRDFSVAAILQTPSKTQKLILGDVSNLQSAIDLDTVLQETGLYSLFITSRETEKTGRYTINKKLAAPAAYILNDAADFCARLNFVKKHADVYFNFVTKEITRVEKNMFTQTFYATDAELVKGKTATIEKGFRTLYSSTIYTGGKKEVEKKFAEYEKMIRSCLVNDWDFKSSDDPADKNGNIHTLTASTGYVRSLVMNIVLDKSGNYSLVVEIK